MNTRDIRSQKGLSKNFGTWDDIADAPFADRAKWNESAFPASLILGSDHVTAGDEQRKSTDSKVNKPAKPTLLQIVVVVVVMVIAGAALFALLKMVLSVLGPVLAVLCIGALAVRILNSKH